MFGQCDHRSSLSHRIDVVLIVIQADGEVLRLEHLISVYPG